MRIRSFASPAAIGLAVSFASAQIRVVQWNTLDKPLNSGDTPAVTDFRTIVAAIAADSVNGIAKRPDLFLLQEQSVSGTAMIAAALNAQFGVSSYVAVTPGSQGTSDRIAFVFDSSTLTLNASVLIPSGGTRPFVRAAFTPAGYNVQFNAYSAHLRAGQESSNAALRATETATMRTTIDNLGATANVLVSGDLNLYNASEQAYQNLLAAGTGQMFDPINTPGTWNNNGSFAAVHTQSTRTTDLGDGGATGGMDDRFDFQLTNANLIDGEGLSYIGPTAPGTAPTHSYRAFGNGGTTFNLAVNHPANTSKPASVLNALHRFSDHLPVVADYQLPAVLAAELGASPTDVVVGAAASIPVLVRNAAPTSFTFGADELDYEVTAAGSVGTVGSGSLRVTSAPGMHSVPLNTNFIGELHSLIRVTTNSPDAPSNLIELRRTTRVLDHALPSFDSNGESTDLDLDFGVVGLGLSSPTLSATIVNLDFNGGLTAPLDVRSIFTNGASSSFQTDLAPFTALAAGDSLSFQFTALTDSLGSRVAAWTLNTFDTNLPGSRAVTPLFITASVIVATPGDTDLDDDVDFSDLLTVAQSFGTAGGVNWDVGDFDRNDTVDFADLLLLAGNFGTSLIAAGELSPGFAADFELARSLVPEPATISFLLGGAILLGRRIDRRRVV